MEKILVPVDGSEVSLRAVQYVIKQSQRGRPSGLLLLNVQPPILSGGIKRFIAEDVIQGYHQEEGNKALAPACALLDAANVPYTTQMLVGHAAETIVSFARAQQCDAVVMGGRGLGSVVGMLLGSTTTKVLGLSELPVTVIK
jgi:nucleotide-binding universal stress UspA family protein